MNNIRYLYAPEAKISDRGRRIGTVTDTARKAYTAYTVANDADNAYIWLEDYIDIYIYRKEYHSMRTEVKTVMINDREMDYFRFGKEDGEKLIILPGLSLRSVMPLADAITGAYALLAEEYDIYLFDRVRSFPKGYNTENMADDLIAALKAIGLDHVHVMGVSMGGMIAEQLALRSPQTVRSLLLCSSASRISDASQSVFEQWRKPAEQREIPALMDAFGKTVYTPSFYEQYKDAIIASGEGAKEREFENFLTALDAIKSFDVYDRLNEIRCPVYVIGALKDQVLGVEASREIMEKLGCEGYICQLPTT